MYEISIFTCFQLSLDLEYFMNKVSEQHLVITFRDSNTESHSLRQISLTSNGLLSVYLNYRGTFTLNN